MNGGRVLAGPAPIPNQKQMPKSNHILPPPRPPGPIKASKVYLHVLLPQEVITSLKLEAHKRNYSVSDLLEIILRKVIPG